MARIQYQGAAKAGGYRPQQVDDRNIARLREETARQIEGMRQAANAEIDSRREVAKAMKENAAYTRSAEEKNYQIQTENTRREINGLQAQAQRDQEQAAINQKATESIFSSISTLSESAAKYVKIKAEAKAYEDYKKGYFQQTDEKTSIYQALTDVTLREKSIEYNAKLEEAKRLGQNPKVIAELQAQNPALLKDRTTGEISRFLDFELEDFINNNIKKRREELGGKLLSSDETKQVLSESWDQVYSILYQNNLSSEYVKPHLQQALQRDRARLSLVDQRETTEYNEITSDTALTNVLQASQADLQKVWSVSWPILSGIHGPAKAWDLVQQKIFNAQNPKTGQFYLTEEEIAQLPIHIPGEKSTTFGEKFSKNGVPIGRYAEALSDRIKLDLQYRKQQKQADDISNAELEQQLFRAFQLNRTEANAEQSQRMYVSITGRESVMLANAAKHLTYKAEQRQETIKRISNLRDFELTPEIVADAVAANPTEGAAIKQRYDAYNAKWKGAGYKKAKTGLEGAVSGTTAIGTNKPASNGSQPVINYLHAELESRTALYESTLGFEAAYLKAGAELEQEYKNGFRDETSKYYRKVHRNGTVSYPNLPVGKVSAAEALKRQVDDLRVDAKTSGLNKAIQNYFADHPERLEYIANNYDKPTFKPHPLELALKGMANGMPLHAMYNRGFELSGNPTRLASPLQSNGQDIVLTPAQQKIMDDPYSGPNARMGVIRSVLNPSSFQDHGTMRPGPIAAAVRVQTDVSGQGFTAKGLNDAYGRPIVFGSPEALSDLQRLIQLSGGRVKASDITSSQRSHVHNKKVDGSATSYHLEESGGLAFDITGKSLEFMRANPDIVKQANWGTEKGYVSAHGHYVHGL